jgi:RNA polymerase sigma-70 factor (ECF subfamily)
MFSGAAGLHVCNSMLSDKNLMLAVRNGDMEPFGVLFQRHHDRLFSFFYRMTADAAVSEDLTQEVFVRMLKYRRSFGDSSDFSGWMYQIARNVRIDHFRKSRMETVPIEKMARAAQAAQAFRLENAEQVSLLHRALLELSEDKRELLVLARFEEISYETIASLLSIEVGTVRVRVHRALRELRVVFLKLSDEGAKCDVKKP